MGAMADGGCGPAVWIEMLDCGLQVVGRRRGAQGCEMKWMWSWARGMLIGDLLLR